MIQINLLPHREAARKKRREMFAVQLGLAVGAGVFVSLLVFAWYQARIDMQEKRNALLSSEIKVLDEQIKEIATLQAELDGLKARQIGVESLQADRNMPVYLLDEMAKQLPDGVYLTSLRQDGSNISLTGVAQTQERVSELLRNFSGKSEWITQPQLVEIVAASVNVGPKDQRRAYNFTMRVVLKRVTSESAADPANKAGTKG
jgi:type IV pilus assembly protein PilN